MMTFEGYEIRPLREADAEAYFAVVEANREYMATYFPKTMEGTTDLAQTRRFMRDRIILAKQMKHLTYVITEGSSERLIGGMSLRDFDWTVAKAEMGFFLARDEQRQGIATKAVATLLSFGFTDLQLHKVIMRIGTAHHRSRRVAERNGFQLEGLLRQDFKTYQGDIVDIAYYGLLKRDHEVHAKIRDEEK